ncbi:MAG: ABC transporter permease [Erysipelotrichales bacterium]|nr:ABC transporter permease [Erysipelotrichales bacterium]
MVLFVYVFGGTMDMGSISVVNFIVPGIILQTIGQNSATTAIALNNDLTKGIIDRFHTMPIAKSSLLTGHVLAAFVSNAITATAALCTALIVGFRPEAGLLAWLGAIGIILLYILVVTWLAIISGLHSKTAESAGGLMMIVAIIPFLSSGFAPTETMPRALRVFAENQPVTPIIDSIRALFLNQPFPDGTLLRALLWSIGLIVVFYILAMKIYKRRLKR